MTAFSFYHVIPFLRINVLTLKHKSAQFIRSKQKYSVSPPAPGKSATLFDNFLMLNQ